MKRLLRISIVTSHSRRLFHTCCRNLNTTSACTSSDPITTIIGTNINDIHKQTHNIHSHHPTRIQLMNQFIQALKSEDITLLFNIVNKLGKLESVDPKTDVDNYINCLQVALKMFLKSQNVKYLKLLKSEIDKYLKLYKNQDVQVSNEVIKEKIGVAFAKATIHIYYLANESYKTRRLSPLIIDFLFNNLAYFKLDLNSVVKEVSEVYLRDCIRDICKRKRLPVPVFQEVERAKSNPFEQELARYKNEYGGISIHDLYKFIQTTKFTWNGRIKPGVKLFQFYETLNSQERQEFMDAYTIFHTEKQEMIEEAMDDLEYIPSEFKLKSNNLIEFVNNNNELLEKWVRQASERFTNMLNVVTPITQSEKIISLYKAYFAFVPVNIHIHSVLAEILGTVGIHNEIPLFEIKHHLRYIFDKGMVKAISVPYEGGLLTYMNVKARDELTSVFVDVLLECATIEISQDNLKLIKTINEANRDTIHEDFLTPNQYGSYPALIKTTSSSQHMKYSVIKLHPLLQSDLNGHVRGKISRLPMIIPPKRWNSLFNGGYLTNRDCVFMAKMDKTYLTYLNQVSSDGNLDSVFMTLNKLGTLAWTINPDMLSVLNQVATFPSGFLKIPRSISDKIPKFKNKFTREKYMSSRGNRITFNMLLDMANTYAHNGEMLYTPYQLDFRGRVYPSSNLSHILGDEFRCLFMFWHSKPLGVDGFNWLKYHLNSMFGNSGFHMNQAIEFVELHKQDIIDSAKDPFKGKQWWLKSKTPFQTLATCMEITKVWEYRENGGKIEEFQSRFPIHQDGSCNGLQHYAALTRDEIGGKAVNLLPQKHKQDIYMEVAKIVESKLTTLTGSADATEKLYAKLGLILLSRKLVKQTVMTTVYGVTLVGASDQVRSKIQDFLHDCKTNPHMKNVIDEPTLEQIQTEYYKVGMFMAKVILGSISSLFAPATAVQQWLRTNIQRILSSFNPDTVSYIKHKSPDLFKKIFRQPISLRPIIWISPSGFPVIQYYVKTNINQHFKSVLSKVVANQGKKSLSPMDNLKNINGIAPNYIHSLDATHMMNTCNSMAQEELHFAAVHDSYWTHACDVDRMGVILRQEFVKMHSGDLLLNLRNDLQSQSVRSYQLVYFKCKDYPKLSEAVNRVRKEYPATTSNEILFYELLKLKEQGEMNEISQLIQQVNPKLYFNKHEYTSSPSIGEKYHRDNTRKIFVFVPVKIQDLPDKGNLDLNQVLHSEFFFH